MIIDILFLVILIWGIYKGYSRGFVLSIFSLAALFIGIFAALKFSHIAAVYLQDWFSISSKYLPLISFLAVFILIIILIRLLGKLVEKFVEFIQACIQAQWHAYNGGLPPSTS